MSTTSMIPTEITRRDEGLLIRWEDQPAPVLIAGRRLRLACPCAECVEEMTNRPLLDPALVPEDIRPVRLELVGGYGLRVFWSDHHSTGIFTFDRLRAAAGLSANG